MAKQTEKKSIWAFGTKQVVYAAIGAALYAVLTWAFNVWQIPPGAGNVGIRPAIVIPPCSLVSRLAQSSALSPASWATSLLTCSAVMASGFGGI